MVAYVANPEISTSVCLIGYHLARAMAEQTGAHVIVHRRDADAMSRVMPADRLSAVGPRRLGDAVRRLAERLFPGKWGLISLMDYPDYLLFDLSAARVVRRALRRGDVPYVLRINPVSFRFPSVLPYLDVPVLTGPHNGGMEWPVGFAHLGAIEADSTGRVRGVGDVLHRLYGDAPRYARILVATEQCASTVPESAREAIVLVSENGITALPEVAAHRGDARRLLFVGRLNTMKVVDVALRALARMPQEVSLTVVGDGPQRESLERLVDELGIRSRVRFVGHVAHSEVSRYYAQAGVLLFPSVRESGGGVILEAMSFGLPCVVADWGGPRVFTRETGVRCRVDSPQALEDDIVDALSGFLADPAAAVAIGDASRQHVADHYLWSEKVRGIHALGMEAAHVAG